MEAMQSLCSPTASMLFARDLDGVRVIVTVNNDDNAASMDLAAGNAAEYVGTLTGEKVSVENGRIHVTVAGNSGNIWVPAGDMPEYKPVEMNAKTPETTNTTVKADNEDQTKEEAAATVAEQKYNSDLPGTEKCCEYGQHKGNSCDYCR